MSSSYQVVLWKQESFVVLHPFRNEFFRSLLEEDCLVARSSPFHIVLTRQELEKLETRAQKYTSPYRDVIRAKIVLLAAPGLSNDVIAMRLVRDTPRQIVSKWRKRFALARLPGLEEQPRGGRPALFPPQRRGSSK